MERSRDTVVVGAGLAGTTAALRAQEAGRDVLLVDKGAEPAASGSSAMSSGVLHIAMEPIPDDPATIFEKVLAVTDGLARREVAEAFAHACGPAVDWLLAKGPEVTRAGGFLRLLPSRGYDDAHGWRGQGLSTVLAALQSGFAAAGGTIAASTKAVRLIAGDDGAVTGVVLRSGGVVSEVAARQVILADGGFAANPALVSTHVGRFADQVLLRAAPTGTGDALRMGLALGAKAVRLQYFYGHLVHRDALSNDRLWPAPTVDGMLDAGILVDAHGERFMDEGRGGVAAANVIARREDVRETWVVAPEHAWETAGTEGRLGVPAPTVNPGLAERGGAVVRALTLNGIADEAGMRRDVLRRSAEECGKALEPPFVAIPIVPGMTLTMGGLLVDGQARVLDADETPVPGLYAAGGSAGGLQGGHRGGYVGGLVQALTLGYIAGAS